MSESALEKPSVNKTRLAVLNTSRELFAAKGYAAVSMRDIGRSVGVQQSSIYNHFDSKQSILFELLFSHMQTLNANLANSHNHRAPPVQQLATFARFHAGYHIDFPDDVFIAYMELRSLTVDNRTRLAELRNQYETCLCEIIQRGMDSGVFRCTDAAVHTRAVIAMLTGINVWYQEGGRLSKDEVLNCYVQAALQSLGVSKRHILNSINNPEVNHVQSFA